MIINSLDELIKLIESKPKKTAVIVMFKSQTCPPCRQTLRYLEEINPTGETNWAKHAREFEADHGMKIHLITIDARDTSVPNNPKIFSIISASQSIRGVPTFDLFYIDNDGSLQHISKARHVGGLTHTSFETYLDLCYNQLAYIIK